MKHSWKTKKPRKAQKGHLEEGTLAKANKRPKKRQRRDKKSLKLKQKLKINTPPEINSL
jgi:hypothetical protein